MVGQARILRLKMRTQSREKDRAIYVCALGRVGDKEKEKHIGLMFVRVRVDVGQCGLLKANPNSHI